MLRHAIDYRNALRAGVIKNNLYSYQQPAFYETVEFLRQRVKEAQSTDDLTVSGYLDLPTSFGKTVIIAKLLEALGVGQPGGESSPRLRKALVLVPGTEDVIQTIGNAEGGFALHAPQLRCTPYTTGAKDLSGDVVVMTYASFRLYTRGVQAGKIIDPQFDLIICDEAQHTLGQEIRKCIETYRQGKVAIGLTASPEYDEDKKVEHLFGHEIHKSNLLSLVKGGSINGVQLIGLATGSAIAAPAGRGDYSEKSLQHLIVDEDRNRSIVEAAKQLVAEGRRGVINAIAGGDCAHAIMLASVLDGQKVAKADGTPHKIRAAAIGNFVPIDERRRLRREYKEGKIDILTQVKLLNENWDETNVDFIINAAPTSSLVRATQRIGRGMRLSEDCPITVIVEFMDEIVGGKRPITAWHVFEQDEIEQNLIITTKKRERLIAKTQKEHKKRDLGAAAMAEQNLTPPGNDAPQELLPGQSVGVRTRGNQRQPLMSKPELVMNLDTLRRTLREQVDDFTARVARTLIIKPQEKLGPPRPNWVTVESLFHYVEGTGMSLLALRNTLIQEGKKDCELALSPQGPRYYVEPSAEDFIANYEVAEYAGPNDVTAADIERKLQTTMTIVVGMIKQLKAEGKIKGKPLRSRRLHRKLEHFTPAEFSIIEDHYKEKVKNIPSKEDAVVLLSDLAKEVKQARGTVQFFLARHHGITGDSEVTSPRTKRKTTGYTPEEAEIVRYHYSHEEITVRAVLLDRIAELSKKSETDIRTLREQNDALKKMLKPGRFADARGDYHYTLFVDRSNLRRVLDAIASSLPPAETAENAVPTVTPVEPVEQKPPASPQPKQPPPPPQFLAPGAPAPHLPPSSPADTAQTYSIDLRVFLTQIRCNPAAARYLLRQVPFADGSIFDNGGEPMIHMRAATWLRRRVTSIADAPKLSTSDRELSERWARPLSTIHGIARQLMPPQYAMGLFRDAEDNIVTFHYNQSLTAQIEHVLRQQQGRPKA